MRSSFDIIGDIAIIEAKTKSEEKQLKEKILRTHPHIKAILKKESATIGKYRLRKYSLIFTDKEKVKKSNLKATETIHKEYGCSYKLDVKKVYFSPREGTIRNTIAEMVNPGEKVLVMFAGIGPYPITIAKRVKDCEVVGIEANPIAMKYAEQNIRMNKVGDRVRMIHSDVKDVKEKMKFDRIVMPLGTLAYRYVEIALPYAKKGAIIHVYGEQQENSHDLEKWIVKSAAKKGKKVKILATRKVLPYAPRRWKVCVDVKVI